MRSLLLVMALLAAPLPAAAGELGKLTVAATSTPLLGGRLTVRVPAGAKLQARQQSIMAAPESNEEETRVVIDAGAERMVIMTYELFALGGADFAAGVKQSAGGLLGPDAAQASYDPVALGAGSGVEAIRVVPAKLDLTRKAIPSQVLFVQHRGDRTVQMMIFYVNPAAGTDLAGCRRLADRVVASLAAGKRALPIGAGPRRLQVGGATLVLDTPAGYAVTRQSGHDFTVFRLRKLAPLSAGKAPGSLGLYLGGHPAYQHKQSDSAPQVTREKGQLLGTAVEWHRWTVQGRTTLEAILPVPGQDRLTAHLFYGSGDPAVLAELKGIATSLRRP